MGEVWLGSGQSNMAGTSDYYARPDRTANAPRDPGLPRLLEAAPYPRVRLIRAGWPGWRPATRESLEAFSALMTGFGLPLHAALDRPVGLLVGAVGGTPSGFWVPEEDYRADAACKAVAAAFAATTDLDAARKRYQTALALWEQEDAAAKAAGKKMGRGRPLPPQPAGECHEPIGHLFERQLRPFVPFAIRGVLWDQGEGGTAIAGVDQYTLMGALIRGWRRIWGQGEFPFLYVQKPSGGGCAWDPVDPVTCRAEPFAPLPPAPPHARGGLYQELHIRIMEYPRTTMVTASDLGSGTHPDNKSGYGARAARVALGAVYGRPEEWSGPRYADHRVEGGAVHVRFKHTGKGLAWRHGDRLQGFAVAGADRVFRWADAVITGDTVAVSSPAVPQPVAVRYAWDKTHPWANLFNRDGLPALTFRTDEW